MKIITSSVAMIVVLLLGVFLPAESFGYITDDQNYKKFIQSLKDAESGDYEKNNQDANRHLNAYLESNEDEISKVISRFKVKIFYLPNSQDRVRDLKRIIKGYDKSIEVHPVMVDHAWFEEKGLHPEDQIRYDSQNKNEPDAANYLRFLIKAKSDEYFSLRKVHPGYSPDFISIFLQESITIKIHAAKNAGDVSRKFYEALCSGKKKVDNHRVICLNNKNDFYTVVDEGLSNGKVSQVRYFYPEDKNIAIELVRMLGQKGLSVTPWLTKRTKVNEPSRLYFGVWVNRLDETPK